MRLAARQFLDPLSGLPVLAAAVSFAIGEHLEAGVIAAIVVLNAVLGFVQELGAERALLALRSAVEPVASVVRGGHELRIPAHGLVPGDLVVLREGDRVPADGRLAQAERLQVDESALTGESAPVGKQVAAVPPTSPLAERSSMAYAGTGITRGRGLALVTATGPETEMGSIAALAAAAKPPATPLQRRLAGLSRLMVGVGLGLTAALTAGMLARDAPLEEAFLVGVSVAIAAVPEGLAATVTIALAQGARAMTARGAIVRRLGAVETLGAATLIATDKTGTLTVNQLRVTDVYPCPGRSRTDVLEAGVLASTATLVDDGDGLRVAGDSVDGALLLALRAETGDDPRTSSVRSSVLEVPFDPRPERQASVYREPDGPRRRQGRPRAAARARPRRVRAARRSRAPARSVGVEGAPGPRRRRTPGRRRSGGGKSRRRGRAGRSRRPRRSASPDGQGVAAPRTGCRHRRRDADGGSPVDGDGDRAGTRPGGRGAAHGARARGARRRRAACDGRRPRRSRGSRPRTSCVSSGRGSRVGTSSR